MIFWHYGYLANKPRGLQAARKLRTSRRVNRWVSADFILSLHDNSKENYGFCTI